MSETIADQPVSRQRAAAAMVLVTVIGVPALCLFASLAETSQRRGAKTPAAPSNKPQLYSFAASGSIPAITEPRFVAADKAEAWLQPNEPVLAIALDGEARAYSVWQLERHLVVNDRFGSRAVAITWCPFAHAAIVYSRAVGGRQLTLEADGRLLNDQIVLRDRESGTVWTQAEGLPIEGPLSNGGAKLSEIPVLQTTWKAWKQEQPATVVLEKAGPDSAVRSSVYADYDNDASRHGLGHTPLREPRMGGKALIVGMVSGRDRLAVPLERIKNELAIDLVVDQQAVAAVYDPLTFTVRVLRREARGQMLALRRGAGDLFGRPTPPYLIDEQTASSWDFAGRAFRGRMEGHRLPLVPYRLQYWYAWQAYFPKSRVE